MKVPTLIPMEAPEQYPVFDGTQMCLQTDPEVFFPESTPTRVAKRLCNDCDFLEPCRTYAVHYDVYGIWGGTSRSDRKRIRKTLGITPIPMYSTLNHETERGTFHDGNDDGDI